jgi:hypothetical protein
MRRFADCHTIALTIAIGIGGLGRDSAQGENVPGYWAGDVSLGPSAGDNLDQSAASEPAPAALPRTANPAPQNVPSAEPAITTPSRQAVTFYGGRSALAARSEAPRSTVSAQSTAPPPSRRGGKPFQNATNRPALSPYLNLFREEKNTTGIPNYYAFVQPQLEQEATSQRQQIQSQRRERQGQTAADAQPGVAAQSGTGTSAHFMDTAQFYSAWRR